MVLDVIVVYFYSSCMGCSGCGQQGAVGCLAGGRQRGACWSQSGPPVPNKTHGQRSEAGLA